MQQIKFFKSQMTQKTKGHLSKGQLQVLILTV